MSAPLHVCQSGGIIGFRHRDVIADTINVATLAMPGLGSHHVGILTRDGLTTKAKDLILAESTGMERPPCVFSRQTHGFGARPWEQMKEYFTTHHDHKGTELWYYGLRSPLYHDEECRLNQWLRAHYGSPYDLDGALHAGGGLIYQALSRILRGEDLSSFFCSEMCIGALAYVGRVKTRNVSKWSPNKALRFLVRSGICDRPVRIL